MKCARNNRAKFVSFAVDNERETIQLDNRGKVIKTSGEIKTMTNAHIDVDITIDLSPLPEGDVFDNEDVYLYDDDMFSTVVETEVQVPQVQYVEAEVQTEVQVPKVQYVEAEVQTEISDIPSAQVRRVNNIIRNHGGIMLVRELCELI